MPRSSPEVVDDPWDLIHLQPSRLGVHHTGLGTRGNLLVRA
jgi:hypothetical protein